MLKSLNGTCCKIVIDNKADLGAGPSLLSLVYSAWHIPSPTMSCFIPALFWDGSVWVYCQFMEGPWVAVAEQVPFSAALSAGLP